VQSARCSGLKEEVYEYIKENSGSTTREIAKATGHPRCQVFCAIYDLVEEKKLGYKEKNRGRVEGREYSLL
jgi:predicted transcriptional regulator